MRATDAFMLVGALAGAMAYEFHATLAYRCLRLLASRSPYDATSSQGRSASQRRWPFGAFFVAAVFVLGTVNFGAQVAFVLDAFAGRGTAFTGGAAAYASASAGLPASQISNVCCILTILFSDGLLLWRTYIIWQRMWGVIVLPCILYVCLAFLSVTSIYGTARPDSVIIKNGIVSVIYGASTVALNLLLTALIAGRLYYVSRRSGRALGAEYGRTYSSAAAVVIESALPYTGFATAFIVVYIQSSDASQGLFTLFGQIMCISPVMIIWRVARGDGFAQPGYGSRTGTSSGTSARGQRSTAIVFVRQDNDRDDVELGVVSSGAGGDALSLSSSRMKASLAPSTEYDYVRR